MNDSDIPAFTNKILQACKQASKEGWWTGPLPPGQPNYTCCPLRVYDKLGIDFTLSLYEAFSFARGYDCRLFGNVDKRFYILGQGFRKIAETVGF